MTEYQEILSEIVKKELFELILMAVALLILLAIAWISTFIHLKKAKDKRGYSSKTQVKKRRQTISALIAITAIAVIIYALLALTAADTIKNINKDIDEETYVTYTGEYYIEHRTAPGRLLYKKYQSVLLSESINIEYATLYMNNFFEAIITTSGRHNGTVIYGKNSGMIVYIQPFDE